MNDKQAHPNDDSQPDDTFVIHDPNDPMQLIYDRFMLHYRPFGFATRKEDIQYRPMPYRPDKDDQFMLKSPWRITLELYVGEQRMVTGLDLYGDTILGRGPSRPGRIILDLDQYGARDLGVSREHVMLRPTNTKLFAIDQGSTNGTTVNGAPSGRGIATALTDESLLSLGSFVVMVRVIKKPEQ